MYSEHPLKCLFSKRINELYIPVKDLDDGGGKAHIKKSR